MKWRIYNRKTNFAQCLGIPGKTQFWTCSMLTDQDNCDHSQKWSSLLLVALLVACLLEGTDAAKGGSKSMMNKNRSHNVMCCRLSASILAIINYRKWLYWIWNLQYCFLSWAMFSSIALTIQTQLTSTGPIQENVAPTAQCLTIRTFLFSSFSEVRKYVFLHCIHIY